MTENQIDNIPYELKPLKQWVCFSLETNKNATGKPIKVPMIPGLKIRASVSKPGNWRSFSFALSKAASYCGIGFVLTSNDPYTGIDIDNCRNKLTGEISPKAQEIINKLNSYTEVSYSKTGVHIIVKAKPLNGRCKFPLQDDSFPNMEIEIYSTGRYFIFTGNKLGTLPTINQRDRLLKTLRSKLTKLVPESIRCEKSDDNKAVDRTPDTNSHITEIEWEDIDVRTLSQKLADYKNTGEEVHFNAAYKELSQLITVFAWKFLMEESENGLNTDIKEYYWGYTDDNYSEWLTLPMLKALESWNPNRGSATASFKNYFANMVRMLVRDMRASYCRKLNSIYGKTACKNKKIAPLPLKLDKLDRTYRYSLNNDDLLLNKFLVEDFCNRVLTKRQNEIWELMICGYKQNEIADIVGIGRRKVANHQEKILDKAEIFFLVRGTF